MSSTLNKSTQIARTGLGILLGGLLVMFGCMAVFLNDPEQPIWAVVGISVFIVCVVAELLCLRAAKKIFLKHYGRMGLRLNKSSNSDVFQSE